VDAAGLGLCPVAGLCNNGVNVQVLLPVYLFNKRLYTAFCKKKKKEKKKKKAVLVNI
jgi:hypothetical protein